MNFGSTSCALEINSIRTEINSSNALLLFSVIASSSMIQMWGYLKGSKKIVVLVMFWVLVPFLGGET